MISLVLALLASPLMVAAQTEDGLRRTVEALATPASRMTGYPGAEKAGAWLVSELQTMGLDEIYRHAFPVSVPFRIPALAAARAASPSGGGASASRGCMKSSMSGPSVAL